MQIIIKGKNLEVTSAIEDYLAKKMDGLEKFVGKNNSQSMKAEIEIGRTTRHHKQGDIFMAEINLNCDGQMFRAESEKSDLYAAIDEVRDDLEQTIKKQKTKRETIFLRGARSIKKKFGLSPLARFRKK